MGIIIKNTSKINNDFEMVSNQVERDAEILCLRKDKIKIMLFFTKNIVMFCQIFN